MDTAHLNNCSNFKIIDLIKQTSTIMFQSDLQYATFEKMVLLVLIYVWKAASFLSRV